MAWYSGGISPRWADSVTSKAKSGKEKYIMGTHFRTISGPHWRRQRGTGAPKFYKCSAVAEMGDRLAIIDMGQKLGVYAPLREGSWVSI